MTWTLLICIAPDQCRAELVSGGRLFDVGQVPQSVWRYVQ